MAAPLAFPLVVSRLMLIVCSCSTGLGRSRYVSIPKEALVRTRARTARTAPTLSLCCLISLTMYSALKAGLIAPGSSVAFALCFAVSARSEEHTSELQSRLHLVCRLLLEKKKKE